MATCRFQNQDGQRCGMPHGHELEHGNGLLIQGANQVWTEIPVPVFTIKASDPFACALIRTWIILARSFRQTQADGTTKTVDSRKIVGASERYDEFRQYQKDYGTKIPD